MIPTTLFSTQESLGTFSFSKLDPINDASTLHAWVTLPYANFWLMQNYTVKDVENYYVDFNKKLNNQAYLGFLGDTPCFLIEVYDPKFDQVGEKFEHKPGDIGLHFLVAPCDAPVSGFTLSIIVALMKFIFSRNDIQRIVVEPDSRNTKLLALNKYFNLEMQEIQLKEKMAQLAFFTRANYENFIGE
ncbi:MAG: acetyltransferase [Gammaproteobacteria bacterium]|nr:acetyltransferase [Gammaproteobacteria bacterium]